MFALPMDFDLSHHSSALTTTAHQLCTVTRIGYIDRISDTHTPQLMITLDMYGGLGTSVWQDYHDNNDEVELFDGGQRRASNKPEQKGKSTVPIRTSSISQVRLGSHADARARGKFKAGS